MKNVIGYIRVSTEKQFKTGLSLNTQKKQIRAFANANGLNIVKIHKDGASAQNEGNISLRPGLNEAIEMALQRGYPIITASADRFSRSEPTYDRFLRHGGRVYSADVGFGADESAMRNAILRSDEIGKGIGVRTRAGLERAKARDVKFGNPRLQDARAAAAVVNRANALDALEEFRDHRLQACGGDDLSASQLADAFNNSGYPTTRGEAWTSANVRRLLRKQKAADEAADLSENVVDDGGGDAAMFDAERRFTPYGFRLFRADAVAKGIEQQKVDDFCQKVAGKVLTEEVVKRLKRRLVDTAAI